LAPSPRSRDLTALALTAPAPSVAVIVAMILLPGTVIGTSIFVLAKLWLVALPWFWHVRVERRPPSLSPMRHGGLGAGVGLGLLIVAVVIVAYELLGSRLIEAEQIRSVARRTGIGTPATFLAGAVFWITVNSVLEEYVYRWFMFRHSERLLGSTIAVFAAASIFTVHHVIALAVQFDWVVTIIGSLGVFIGGVAWSWCYRRYRSIWPGYVSHAIVDVAVFWIGWRLIFDSAA
jgi:membrane protease YdiL (CAAX protease family)